MLPSPDTILHAVPMAMLVTERSGRIRWLNPAAEEFLGIGQDRIVALKLADLFGADSIMVSVHRRVVQQPDQQVLRSVPSRLQPSVGALGSEGFSSRTGERGSRGAGVDSNRHSENREGSAPPLRGGSGIRVLPSFTVVGTGCGGEVLMTMLPDLQARQGVGGALDVTETDVEAPSLRTLEGMRTVLTHELRNPLAGIAGAAQLLQRSLRSNEALHQPSRGSAPGSGRRDLSSVPDNLGLAEMIQSEVGRISSLLDRFDPSIRAEGFQCVSLNVHETADHVIQLVTAERVGRQAVRGEAGSLQDSSWSVERAYDPSLPLALANHEALTQVLLNLVRNAIQWCGASGRVTIATRYLYSVRRRSVGADAGGADRDTPIEIQVIDNGPGVLPHVAEDLFQPFVSGRDQGTGLGLTISSELVSAMGGRLSYDSEPGRTRFIVRVPLGSTQ